MRRREDDEVKRNREDQVGRRTGESDQAPLPRRLLEERAPPVLRRDFLVRIVAGELDVSAQRQKRDPVLRLASLDREQFRPEADGEPHRLHAHPLADEQVAELVEEDHDADHQREGKQRETSRLDECAHQ